MLVMSSFALLLLPLLVLLAAPDIHGGNTLSPSLASAGGPILVVGASGGTGLRALEGLLDAGYRPVDIRVLSRNIDKPHMVALREVMGFTTVQADLDDTGQGSSQLEKALRGCVGAYVHSTASDTKKLDTGEESRARNLARAIRSQSNDIRHVIYNSAAGEEGHGVTRIAQKHDVERVFFSDLNDVPFTSLRANLFMEELWKPYTRPAILKGKFPFSVPSERKVYLTSVRDMGCLAGVCFRSPGTTKGKVINVAGDHLCPQEIAAAFAAAQGSPCVHSKNRALVWLSRLFFRDLYQVMKFYQTTTEETDIGGLREEFPGVTTSFASFLNETYWGNRELTYEDLNVVKKQHIQFG